ncbi:MAG: hypothetical protein RL147_1101 [Actinomycetota bacterium]|jgi:hypothetical protein
MKKPIAVLSLMLMLSLLPSNFAKAAIKEPKQVTGFQDAIDRPQDVSYWAWKKSRVQISSNNSKSPPVKLIVGPNTKLSNPKPKVAFDGVTRLYPEFRKPNKIYVIYFSHKDVAWAQNEYKAIFPDASGQETKNFCPKIESCEGASATINKSGDGVILIAVMKNPDVLHTSGALEAHEYTHVLQTGTFFGTSNQMQAMVGIKAFVPWWFAEGGAEFSQIPAIHSSSFTSYTKDRRIWAKNIIENKNGKYTEAWIANFLKPPNTSIWSDPETQWNLYDIGMLTSELFTAIKGPAINIQIFKDISAGMTYEKSFEKHFGIKWTAAVPLIAKSIAKLTGK